MNAQTPKNEAPSAPAAQPVAGTPTPAIDTVGTETDTDQPMVANGDYTLDEINGRIIEEKVFDGRLEKLSVLTSDFRQELHLLMVEALQYARSKHDYSKATRLMYLIGDKLGGDTSIKIRQWFQGFGPFKWAVTKNKDVPDTFKTKDGGYAFRKSNSEKANVFNIRMAEKTPFWTLKRVVSDEELSELLDTDDAYKSFMKRARSLMDDLKEVRGEIKQHPDKVTGSEATKKGILALEQALSHVFQDETVLAAESKKAA